MAGKTTVTDGNSSLDKVKTMSLLPFPGKLNLRLKMGVRSKASPFLALPLCVSRNIEPNVCMARADQKPIAFGQRQGNLVLNGFRRSIKIARTTGKRDVQPKSAWSSWKASRAGTTWPRAQAP